MASNVKKLVLDVFFRLCMQQCSWIWSQLSKQQLQQHQHRERNCRISHEHSSRGTEPSFPLIFNTRQLWESFKIKPYERKTPACDLEQTLGITSQPELTGCLICLLNLVWTRSQAACGNLQWFCSEVKVKVKGFSKVKCKYFNVWGIYSCI